MTGSITYFAASRRAPNSSIDENTAFLWPDSSSWKLPLSILLSSHVSMLSYGYKGFRITTRTRKMSMKLSGVSLASTNDISRKKSVDLSRSTGRKAIDLVLDVRAGNPTAPVNPAAGAGRGRSGGPQAVHASAAEIRAMLENAASRK